MFTIKIDDKEYEAEEGMTVLEVARKNSIYIPTLCYHPALKPLGSCKICAVEITGKSEKSVAIQSCLLKVKDGLAVKTCSEVVEKARTKAFQRLLQMAPSSEVIRRLAETCGIDLGPTPDNCIRCRLCVSVCKEIVGANALKIEKKDGTNFIVLGEGHCIGCGTCANICPTDAIKIEDTGNIRTVSIRGEIIGRHLMDRCEGCGKFFATHSFLKNVEHRTIPCHPDVKVHHTYCPNCAKLFSDRVRSLAASCSLP